MSYVISAGSYAACGACVDVCPEGTIAEKDPVYAIDPDKCGACESSCPNNAIATG